MKKIFFLTFTLFIISIIQFNFLPAVFPFAFIPNILILITLIYTLFEDPNKNFAFFIAVIAGLLNDLISPVFGFYTIIIFGMVYFLKILLKKYVQLSFIR